MKKLEKVLKIRITERQYQKIIDHLILENTKSKVIRKMIDDYKNKDKN